ncbi:MAG TPA: RNA-guided pseudouridylation complex pseudouridine synthase subunit Cbf5 [Acidobacteriota bacterium]|nr:RNA-guided pseudouridylation complex pseudouridine synthase subunit Cbf5 [Acidobacteriota bacterium]
MELPALQTKRTVIVRREEPTNPAYGKSPENWDIKELLNNGIVCINKPKGPTSHQISGYVKDILGVSAAGHSGTLDPGVTGVLPIALGEGTKAVQALINAGKEYVCYMHIHKEISEEKIRNVCAKFVGDIMQLPPVKSAVKRQLRKRTIYYLDIIEIDGQDVLFRVGCQAGTYIRKLCSDIGAKLGCGAHMQQLIRTKAATFSDKEMHSLQELTDAVHYLQQGDESAIRKIVLPVTRALVHLPKVWVFDATIDPITHGAPVAIPGISKLESDIKKGDMVAVLSLKDEFVCLANAQMTSEEMQSQPKGIALTLARVYMKEGIYPKIEKTKTPA